MKTCTICKSSCLKLFLISNNLTYWECKTCKAKILDSNHYIRYNDEKKHYLKHNNSLTDKKYHKFLFKLIKPLKEKILTNDIGLDYGCGYAPALVDIFKKYGIKVELYDPFFFPNKTNLSRKYNFITCSEVVEHFFKPFEEFNQIDNLLHHNSWFGVMTSFLPKDHQFENWHYRRDPTHVVFYKKKTFKIIASQRKWETFFPSENIVLFYKK